MGAGHVFAGLRRARGAERLLAGLAVVALGTLASGLACQGDDDDPGGDDGPYRIVTEDAVQVAPSGSRALMFLLLDAQNQPAPGRVLEFAITNEARARGATLSVERAVTSSEGRVELQLIAGLITSFKLRVSASNAPPLMVDVFVDPQKRGPLEIAPTILAPPEIAGTVSQVRLTLVHDAACARVNLRQPVPNLYDPRVLAPGATTTFRSVSTESPHAVVGQGLDAAGVVVDGCVDLPGAAVLEEALMRLTLPLYPLAVSPVGRYQAQSLLTLRGMPRAVATVTGSYAELAACRFDPGRLWLNCTVDALGAATAEDPLDCLPSAIDEAAFDGRLSALRGLPLSDPQRSGAPCRDSVDGAGRPALETQIEGMFAGQTRLQENLQAIASEVAGLFAGPQINSTMELTATSDPQRFHLEHRLDALLLPLPPDPFSVDLQQLGVPVRTARFVAVNARGNELFIERHGFTLRLGTAARRAVEGKILPRRGYPAKIPEFVTQLFASARYLDRGTSLTGCAALSALVCPLVRGADQCLVPACGAGVAALGQNLQEVFGRLDGRELDLLLEGSTRMIERNGDGKADALGWLLLGTGSSAPGIWLPQILGSDEQIALSGFFTADRMTPP